ncbi:hypothetical protein PV08_06447 [Exophiala spinifera]|uniref:Uncharacterized protein n=1 Tax=Exophiala spinifera TaxID=91928 RepID=A0A0D2BCQ0_9EURO|nr:uncharacterized protein PV08_06447 [Exophiala spinifera]KIW16395.1 hypothetical protein PV08_06447 [Exophiala spinifera]
MVNLAKRMRNFQPLLAVQYGKGAAVLPPPPSPQLTRLTMKYPRTEWSLSNQGPRMFAKDSLPRLKYHNPSLPIRVEDTQASTLELTFESTDKAALETLQKRIDSEKLEDEWTEIQTKLQEPTDLNSTSTPLPIFTRNGILALKGKHSREIWRWFQHKTACKDVSISPQDELLRRKLQDTARKSEADRVLVKAGMDALRKQQAELKKAREAAERLTSEA